jgi:hypothetical protein
MDQFRCFNWGSSASVTVLLGAREKEKVNNGIHIENEISLCAGDHCLYELQNGYFMLTAEFFFK